MVCPVDPSNVAEETLSLRAKEGWGTGLTYEGSTAPPALREREHRPAQGNPPLDLVLQEGLKGAPLPTGAPREGGLTSGCGAGMRRTVDLPPREACTDLAGLVVRDPGF